MHQKSGKLIAVFIKTEKDADSHIIDAAFHCTVHRLGVIIIIMFRSGRVKLKVTFFVVRLLEENVSSDSGFFKLAVVFDSCCSDIDIDTADSAIFMLDTVNGVDAF